MHETLRRILLVVGREHLPRYYGLGLLMLLAALLEAIGIGIVIPFLGAVSQPEAVLASGPVQRVTGAIGISPSASQLAILAGSAMIVVFLLKGALVLTATWVQGRLLHRQRARLSGALFAHYLRLPYPLFLQKNLGHLIHVVTGVSTNFATVFMAAVMLLAAELMVCLTITALLLLVDPVITFVVAVFMASVGGAYVLWSKAKLTRVGREQHSATLGLNRNLMEGLGSLKETRIAGAEGYFLRRFERLAATYTRYSTQLYVLNHAPRVMAETLFVVLVAAAVMLLAASGRDLMADLPVIVLFGIATVRLLPSFNRMLSAFTSARVNLVAMNTLFDELGETRRLLTPAPASRVHGTAPLDFERQLRLDGVSYRYPGEQTPTLDRISLEIRKGEVIGLVGRSGAGKTTLVDVLLGLLAPLEGEVLVDDASIRGREGEWSRLVGYIPQSIHLIDDSIRRNVAFGVEDERVDEARLSFALEAAQLAGFVAALPQRLDAVVGDRGIRLSGGQRQRIGIARALYRDPKLLVLDEATSALDLETESAINEAVRQLGRSKTLIVIAHRLSTVKDCDRLYLIDEGRVADTGTYRELAERNAWFRAIHEILA
jgi:ATP-binding cassette subfamily C protein